MAVDLIKKVRDITGLKNYGIAKELRALGVEITTQGIDGYERDTARSMRLDVLAGLDSLVKKLTGKEGQVFKWTRDEFGPLKKKE